jgi:hypothetical protein
MNGAPLADGKTVGSPGTNKAIEPAKRRRRYYRPPVGHHISFSIRLSSRVDLHGSEVSSSGRDRRLMGGSRTPPSSMPPGDAFQKGWPQAPARPLPWGDAIGDFRVDRVLDEFSILKGGHFGYRIEPTA